MLLGFVLLFAYGFIVWLVFFRFRWLKFTIAWGFFSTFFVLHFGIIFLLGLRYVAPASTEARVIQHTIQITPRLSEPTLVTAVLVEPNVRVKRGTPLFQFDRRIYEAKVKQLDAQLAQAKQNVLIMKSDIQVASEKVVKLKSELQYAQYQQKLSTDLAKTGSGPEEDAQKWSAQGAADNAAIKEAQAEEERSRLKYQSEIGGVNTAVAGTQAELDQARFYLDNTLIVAPEDGYIMNLQVRPGMVAGDVRFGAIASFICDADRYLLANYFQENLKYVKPGQPVEVALDLYPGQIWPGKVEAIWQGSGAGQMLPSGTLPSFNYLPAEIPQGQFVVAITMDDPVLKAFREVENALANELLLAKRLPLDQNAVVARTEAVRIATVQYKAGRRDLLWVSNLQTSQLANEADLIKLASLQRVNRVQLYLALGGSFDQAPATTVQQID